MPCARRRPPETSAETPSREGAESWTARNACWWRARSLAARRDSASSAASAPVFGVAMLPMQSVELTIEEMRFARKTLGMRGGLLRPNPYSDRMLHHPVYDPFSAEAQELDFSIGLHTRSAKLRPPR